MRKSLVCDKVMPVTSASKMICVAVPLAVLLCCTVLHCSVLLCKGVTFVDVPLAGTTLLYCTVLYIVHYCTVFYERSDLCCCVFGCYNSIHDCLTQSFKEEKWKKKRRKRKIISVALM